MTASIFPLSPEKTWLAVVGLTRPDGLADGAAIGPPKASSNRCATLPAGIRTATEGSPAVTSDDRPDPSRTGKTSVSGPGHSTRATAFEARSSTAISPAASKLPTCTISGLKLGRPFAS